MLWDDAAMNDLLDGLSPFDRSVVRLRYQAAESVPGIAAALTSTTEQVAAALMGVYRRVAATLESPSGAEPI